MGGEVENHEGLTPNGNAEGTERAKILARIVKLSIEREGLASQIANLNNEESSLIGRLREIEKPSHKPRKPRLCNVCKKPTAEWFGGIPQCARHIRAGVSDAQAARIRNILEDAIYGTD